MRNIAILGSTGSIGTQALQVVDWHPEHFCVAALAAHTQAEALFEQVRKYRPALAALTGGEVPIPDDLRGCQWLFGPGSLQAIAEQAPAEDVLVAVVGIAGLGSVLVARQSGKRVLLANKEALVSGGALVMGQCQVLDGEPSLIPVDSEHSAIFQCLQARPQPQIKKILLTASGGPFRQWEADKIKKASVQQALRHPRWQMGRKITIDSASLFNKALEIIEAKWLFGVPAQAIDVVVHPQSIVHSMVAFADGAVLAQLGQTDMRTAIQYAMAYPRRLDAPIAPPDLFALQQLAFEAPDPVRFPALRLAYEALDAGGAACCILNAANEVAVAAFLAGAISFGRIPQVVEETMQRIPSMPADTLSQVQQADGRARQIAMDLVKMDQQTLAEER